MSPATTYRQLLSEALQDNSPQAMAAVVCAHPASDFLSRPTVADLFLIALGSADAGPAVTGFLRRVAEILLIEEMAAP